MMNIICVIIMAGFIMVNALSKLCDLREENWYLFCLGFWEGNEDPADSDDDWFYNGEEWLYKGQTIDEMLNDYEEIEEVLEKRIEEIIKGMAQALEEADFDTYDELEEDYYFFMGLLS